MTDEELVLYFNEYKLAKLESYLLKNGSSVEHELQNLLDRFYEQTVPEHERMEVEAQIELEREREAAAREASRRFAVVHFHEGDDDFFFTSELRNSFYSIANLYRSTLKDEIGKYTLDSIAQSNFSATPCRMIRGSPRSLSLTSTTTPLASARAATMRGGRTTSKMCRRQCIRPSAKKACPWTPDTRSLPPHSKARKSHSTRVKTRVPPCRCSPPWKP